MSASMAAAGHPVPTGPVVVSLVGRDLARVPRHPLNQLNMLFFPVFFVVVSSGVFASVAHLPGFPGRTLFDWMLPMGVVAGCVSAATVPGIVLARDIESGFFDRLMLAPVRPMALVAAPLVAAMCRALIPFLAVLLVGLVGGVHLPGGPASLLALLVASEGSALCAGAWAVGLALRVGTVHRCTRLTQFGIFFVVYLSTAQAPLSILTGWLHEVARVNPMTNVLLLARAGFIGDVTWARTWPGLVALGAGATALVTFAVRGVRLAVASPTGGPDEPPTPLSR